MSAQTGPAPPGQNVISAYLANRLTETEAQAFEQYCLEHPDFASDVERDLQLKVGLAQIQPQVPRAMTRPQSWWPLALAASIVLAALGFLLLRSEQAPPTLFAFRAISALPATLHNAPITRAALVQTRGNQSTTRVIASADGVVELRFPANDGSQNTEYTVEIAPESPSGTQPLALNGLKSGPDGYLSVYLPARQMVGKHWVVRLRLSGHSQGSSGAQDFHIQFNAPDATSN
jgi:hypothetical protein